MPTVVYKPYDVVAVPFPFVDAIQSKRRPAVVLSSAKHQMDTGHCSLLMITSANRQGWSSDLEVQDLEAAGLPRESVMRQKIFTVDGRLILRKIGHLSLKDRQALRAALRQHLSL